jgi:peptidoglycan/LPS O-acetylase OafA/YrhL
VPKRNRIPSLDGLRALSISLVLVGHLSGTQHFGSPRLGIGDFAELGVMIFFVISGFLITNLLIGEYEIRGRISLKLFYARRALRIFPAAYCFIGFVYLLSTAGILHLNRTDFLYAVTYTVNYEPLRPWQIGHLWSLSVEEQFYLFWPFAVANMGPRRLAWVSAVVILLAPLARAAAWVWLRDTPYYRAEMFPMVADSLAAGCLLASQRGWLEKQDWYLRLFRPAASVVLLLLVLGVNRYMGYTVVWVLGTSLINFLLAVLIHRSIYCSRDWMGAVLNWTPMVFFGILSYSLYIWQQLFLNRYSMSWPNVFPQNIMLTFSAALLSYLLLERPLMSLRSRLSADSTMRQGKLPVDQSVQF